MLFSAKVAFNTPITVTSFAKVAFSATANVLFNVDIPVTVRLSSNMASSLTVRSLLIIALVVTVKLLPIVTSVERESAGKTPPIILLDGMLLSSKLAISLPVTVTFLSNVAFSATANVLFNVDVPVTVNLLPTERSSLTCASLTAVKLSLTNNRFVMVTSLSNVSAGNPFNVPPPVDPPTTALAGILFGAYPAAVKIPSMVTFLEKFAALITNNESLAIMLPLTVRLSAIVASSLTIRSLVTVKLLPIVTSAERESAGKTPPIILDDGILLSAKVVLSVPVTVTSFAKVAFSATDKNLLAIMLPLTVSRSVIIASSLTNRSLLTVKLLPIVTSVERESAGKTPPIILDDGILLSAKVVLSVPVTVTSFAKVAFSATDKKLLAIILPVTVIFLSNTASSNA